MVVTCANCGNRTNLPGTTKCNVCGAVLVATKATTASAILVSTTGRRYGLNDLAESLIGSRGCAICLNDPGVAPRHARIAPSSGGFVLEDLAGATRVNGRSITGDHPLQPGDQIEIGRVTLTYQGPATVASTAAAAAGLKGVTPSVPGVGPSPSVAKLGVTLKSWGKRSPTTEGEITDINGPHMRDRSNMVQILGTLALGVLMPRMAFLPMLGGRAQIPTWYIRIRDAHTGQDVSVLMIGRPSSLPRLGDVIAVWGQEDRGNVLMQGGYSYATDSEIRLKR